MGVGVIMVAAITLSTILSFNYSEKLLLEAASDDLVKTMNRQEENVQTIINEVIRDAQLISNGAAVRGIIQGKRQTDGGSSMENWNQHLERAFIGMIQTKNYKQIRFIGLENGGQELVRVDGPNNPGEHPKIVRGADLQQKGHRDYVMTGAKLQQGQTYISSITLNREHGVIQRPWNPTQRFLAPVFISDGNATEPELVGLVVINTDAGRLMHQMNSNSDFDITLVNSSGGILYHKDQSLCWQFEFESGAGLNKTLPHAWKLITSRNSAIDWNDPDGHVHVTSRIALGDDDDAFLGLVVSTSPEQLLTVSNQLKKRITIMGSISVFIALLMGSLLVKRLIKPILLLTVQADQFVSGERTAIDVSHGQDEVGHLGRSFENLINSLEEQVQHRTKELVATQDELEREAKIIEATNKALALSLYSTSAEELLRAGLDLLMNLDFLAMEDQGAAFLVDEETSELVLTAHRNLAQPLHKQCARVPFGSCLCGRAAESGKILFKRSTDPEHEVTFEGMHRHAHYNVPLMDGPAVLGMLALYVPYDTKDSASNREFLTRFSDILAGAIRRLNTDKELKSARQEAVAANDSKSAFLANMSHEIRTPMTAILGYTDLLAEDNISSAERTENLQTIRQNGAHLLTIINDILDISKIEAGKMEIETLPVSLWDIVSDIQNLLDVRAKDQGILLCSSFLYPLPEIIISDPVRLRQVLLNLVGNSIKFTKDGEVRITSALVDEKIEISVSDTGIGMSPEQVQRLFQPFSQADASTTRKFGGTGLGLTISKRLTEMMGGGISLKSDLGKGSTFKVIIDPGNLDNVAMVHECPLKPSASDSKSTKNKNEAAESARILLAEDTLVNQKLAVRILSKAGHSVETANNGQEALDMALEQWGAGTPYEVILMDMQMPIMDGYEATIKLREAGYTMPVVALTANAMASDREKCLDAGCDDFATKPFQKAKLLNTIEQWRAKALQLV